MMMMMMMMLLIMQNHPSNTTIRLEIYLALKANIVRKKELARMIKPKSDMMVYMMIMMILV